MAHARHSPTTTIDRHLETADQHGFWQSRKPATENSVEPWTFSASLVNSQPSDMPNQSPEGQHMSQSAWSGGNNNKKNNVQPTDTTFNSAEPRILHTMIANAASTLSLRKYIHWIVSWDDVHRYQAVHHTQATDTRSISSQAVVVVRNLIVLEAMYRPGRVMLPTQYAREAVELIHATLIRLKNEMNYRCDQIQEKARTLQASGFVKWIASRYTLCGQQLDTASRGFRQNPDSLRDQRTLVNKAIVFYNNSDWMYDTTATNTLVDVIVSTLKKFLLDLTPLPRPRESEFQIVLRSIRERREGKRESTAVPTHRPATSPTDQLFWTHPAPYRGAAGGGGSL